MMKRSFLLLCIFLACSGWRVQGMSLQVRVDDEQLREPIDVEWLPGICWGCKWALEKVKRVIGPTTTAESIAKKLRAACDELGLLKSECKKFVESHLGVLIEELTTTDDVKTVCIKAGACKRKEMDLILFPNTEESRRIKMSEVA